MNITATLGSIPLPIAADQEIPGLVWEPTLIQGGRGDVARAGRLIAPPARILPLDIVIPADPGDDTGDLEATVSAINAALSVRNTLVLVNDEGGSATFATYQSSPLPQPINSLYRFGYTYRAVAQILVEPYAYGTPATISSSDLQTPGGIDLSAMTGEYPTQLTVSVDPGASTPATMHGVWLSLCPDKNWSGYMVEATAVTGWDDEVADGTLGVNVVRFAAADAADVGTVNVTGFPSSPYLVLARISVTAGGTLSLDTPYTEPVSADTNHYHWVNVGEIVLPTQKSRSGAAVTLSITGDATTQNAYCQRLCFLPLRWGFLSYHDLDGHSDAIGTLRAEWEDIYRDDVVDYENVLGGGLKALGGQLIVLTEEAAGTAAHHHADVSVAYTPRRNWLG